MDHRPKALPGLFGQFAVYNTQEGLTVTNNVKPGAPRFGKAGKTRYKIQRFGEMTKPSPASERFSFAIYRRTWPERLDAACFAAALVGMYSDGAFLGLCEWQLLRQEKTFARAAQVYKEALPPLGRRAAPCQQRSW